MLGDIYVAPPLARCWAGKGVSRRGLTGRGGAGKGWDGPEEAAGKKKAAMAQQRVLPQSKETLLQSYNKRLKDDVKSIMDNFTEIIKTAKVSLGCSRQGREQRRP